MLRFDEAGEDELLLKAAELKSAQCGGQVIFGGSKGVRVYKRHSHGTAMTGNEMLFFAISHSRYVGKQVKE